MGFAESIARGPIYQIHATDFGRPEPAGISFGLPGVLGASIFIRFGVYAPDAYAISLALFLGLAFYGCYAVSRDFGVGVAGSVLAAIVWLLSPIVYRHEHYSWLLVGFALMPFYFLCALRLFALLEERVRPLFGTALTYMGAVVLAVFMDGYTFVMFFVGSSFLLGWAFFSQTAVRRSRLVFGLSVHLASFVAAYALYALYVGQGSYGGHSNDFFRGWGVDLFYVLIPSRGIHWLPDLLGWSVPRTDEWHFGDASVWVTTFALPLVIAGAVSFWMVRRHNRLAPALVLLCLAGFYLALGPSLKVNSTKPPGLRVSHPGPQSALMAEEHALVRTGSGILVNVPGFKTMRASYRWMALCFLSLWLLCLLALSRSNSRLGRLTVYSMFAACILLYVPNPSVVIGRKTAQRENFRAIDHDLVAPLQELIAPGERVAFVPWGNDFIVNYCAPRVGFLAYNIGGDKNMEMARRYWPSVMDGLGWQIDENSAARALDLLLDGHADALVIPYFETMGAAFFWSKAKDKINTEKNKRSAFLQTLRNTPGINVKDQEAFAVVRHESR